MLRFPAQLLPMMGFSSCDDSDVFQRPKLVSIGGSYSEPFSRLHQQCFAHAHAPTSISSQIMPHLDLPVCPCHSSTQGSLAHHWPQRPSFQLVGAPIKCPPPPPISLWHSMHAHTHAFRIQPH